MKSKIYTLLFNSGFRFLVVLNNRNAKGISPLALYSYLSNMPTGNTTSSCDDPYADASYACGSPSCDAYASFRLA